MCEYSSSLSQHLHLHVHELLSAVTPLAPGSLGAAVACALLSGGYHLKVIRIKQWISLFKITLKLNVFEKQRAT